MHITTGWQKNTYQTGSREIIAEMYIKVYISGMEMSQKIHFLYQSLLKMMIFLRKWQKTTFLVKNFCDKLTKIALS